VLKDPHDHFLAGSSLEEVDTSMVAFKSAVDRGIRHYGETAGEINKVDSGELVFSPE